MKILNLDHLLIPLINVGNKFILCPPRVNKTRNTEDAISAGPKQDFLLYATTTHLPSIKTLQTKKNNKLRLSGFSSIDF